MDTIASTAPESNGGELGFQTCWDGSVIPDEAVDLVRRAARLYIKANNLPEWYVRGQQESLSGGGRGGLIQLAESECWKAIAEGWPEHDWNNPDRLIAAVMFDPILGMVDGEWVPEDGDHTLYRHLDEGGLVLYVGRSRHFLQRQRSHKKSADWWDHVSSIKVEKHESHRQLARAEANAILAERPLFNLQGLG